MSHKLLLTLVAVSTLTSSTLAALLLSTTRVSYATVANTPEQASCSATVEPEKSVLETKSTTQNQLIMAAVPTETSINEYSNESPMMDFTAAESDAAVALFGCDCPPCINALRQLRSQTLSQQVLLSSSQGHCWNALQRQSPQETQDILQNLELQSPENEG